MRQFENQVVLVTPGVRSLREPKVLATVLSGLVGGRSRFGFRLVHFSVQKDHVHLLVEAENRRALARGTQGLSIRIARAVNRAPGRRGRLFSDRFRSRVLSSPDEVKRALAHLLLDPQSSAARSRAVVVDRCSSSEWLNGFACSVQGNAPEHLPPTREDRDLPPAPARLPDDGRRLGAGIRCKRRGLPRCELLQELSDGALR